MQGIATTGGSVNPDPRALFATLPQGANPGEVQEPARATPGPKELFEQLSTGNLQREALQRGLPLSTHLEDIDPSGQYGPANRLDAFERLLQVAAIRTRSIPSLGIYSSSMDAFDKSPNHRALFPEWATRQYRRASHAMSTHGRNIFISEDHALNTLANPYANAADPRAPQLAPAIPLNRIVAMTTPITQDAYRAFYFTDTAADQRLVRVAQGAELPRVKIVGADRTVNLFKYGRALELTYEELRRQQIDRVAFWIARLALRTEIDKVEAIIDVAVNGDGNAGTAATVHNLTALDSAAIVPNLTLRAWLTFKVKFLNPYAITAALVQESPAISLMLLNTGSANVPLLTIQQQGGFGQFTPINPELSDNVALGITSQAPASQIVGMDTRFAVERVFEVGSNIQEQTAWIHRQVNVLTFSEVEGYIVFDQQGTRILNLLA